jgi:putative transposase
VANKQSTDIRSTLKRLVPRRRLEALAREYGVIVRHRTVSIHAFFWTLVLGFTTGNDRTLAGLRRAFEKASGRTIVPSAFYDRFTPALVRLLKAVLSDLMAGAMTAEKKLDGILSSFRDVVLIDSTAIRLHDMLANSFPACRTNHTLAALKAHVILNVRGGGATSVKLTCGRTADGPLLRAGKWVKDRLLLFDLGYYRFQLFACIDREGGFFISRLKEGANPRITALHQTLRGRKVTLVGEKLQDVLERLRRRVLDVEAELSFPRREYRGKQSRAKYRCRLVGIWNHDTKEYHLYLTNIPADRLAAQDIARTYAARWLIELAFRELKCQYRMDEMPSANRAVVETLVYAAFIAMMTSQRLLAYVREKLRRDHRDRLPQERWAAVFVAACPDLLALILDHSVAATRVRFLERMLLKEIVDPNLARLLLLQRVQRGSHAA